MVIWGPGRSRAVWKEGPSRARRRREAGRNEWGCAERRGGRQGARQGGRERPAELAGGRRDGCRGRTEGSEVREKPAGQQRGQPRPPAAPVPAPPPAAPRTQEHRGQPRQPCGPALPHPAAPPPAPRCPRQPRLCSARGASSPPPPPGAASSAPGPLGGWPGLRVLGAWGRAGLGLLPAGLCPSCSPARDAEVCGERLRQLLRHGRGEGRGREWEGEREWRKQLPVCSVPSKRGRWRAAGRARLGLVVW